MNHKPSVILAAFVVLCCTSTYIMSHQVPEDLNVFHEYIAEDVSKLLDVKVCQCTLKNPNKTRWGLKITSDDASHFSTNRAMTLAVPPSTELTFYLVENSFNHTSQDFGTPQLTLGIKEYGPGFRKCFPMPVGYSLRSVESTSLIDAKEWKYSVEFGSDDLPTLGPTSIKKPNIKLSIVIAPI